MVRAGRFRVGRASGRPGRRAATPAAQPDMGHPPRVRGPSRRYSSWRPDNPLHLVSISESDIGATGRRSSEGHNRQVHVRSNLSQRDDCFGSPAYGIRGPTSRRVFSARGCGVRPRQSIVHRAPEGANRFDYAPHSGLLQRIRYPDLSPRTAPSHTEHGGELPPVRPEGATAKDLRVAQVP